MPDPKRKHFQCRHIFADGHRCGSKCLREENFCFYHYRSHKPRLMPEYRDTLSTFELPALEDRSAIQSAITLIAQRIANGCLDSKRAGLLLYALQIASLNLPKPPAEPLESVDEVELDEAGAMIAPACEYATKPHEKNLEEIIMEQYYQDEDEQAARKAAKTLAELKRQAAAESFPLPALYAVAECKTESGADRRQRGGAGAPGKRSSLAGVQTRISRFRPARQLREIRPKTSALGKLRSSTCFERAGLQSRHKSQPLQRGVSR